MVGKTEVKAGLEDAALIEAIRNVEVKFGAIPSAVYHTIKHGVEPKENFVKMANEAIRFCDYRMSPIDINLNQEGDGRILTFGPSSKGKALVMERNGSVILLTFMPQSKR